jgi:hypothetical protein
LRRDLDDFVNLKIRATKAGNGQREDDYYQGAQRQ